MLEGLFLSPVGNGFQAIGPVGDGTFAPLPGALLYTYLAGTESDAPTFSNVGVENENPIVCDSAGRVPVEIWFEQGVSYKLVLTDADGEPVWTLDNLDGINDITFPDPTQGAYWIDTEVSPVRVDDDTFSLAGDWSTIITVGRRVRLTQPGGDIYGSVTAVSTSGVEPNVITTLTVLVDGGTAISAGVTVAYYSNIPAVGNPCPQPVELEERVAVLEEQEADDRLCFTTTGTSTAYVLTVPSATNLSTDQLFMVRFHTASGASPTLNVSGLGAVPLYMYDDAGGIVDAVLTTNQISRVVYSGGGMIVLDQLPQYIPPALVPPHGISVFTSTGTFTVPADVTYIKVTCVGGGGGGGVGGSTGGGEDLQPTSGGTGGTGGTAVKGLDVTPGNVYACTVGAGGTVTFGAGNPGGSSSFGASLVAATGGGGGGAGPYGPGAGTPGTNGVCSVGDYGMNGFNYTTSGGALRGSGGAGASGYWGVPTAGTAGIIIVEW